MDWVIRYIEIFGIEQIHNNNRIEIGISYQVLDGIDESILSILSMGMSTSSRGTAQVPFGPVETFQDLISEFEKDSANGILKILGLAISSR